MNWILRTQDLLEKVTGIPWVMTSHYRPNGIHKTGDAVDFGARGTLYKSTVERNISPNFNLDKSLIYLLKKYWNEFQSLGLRSIAIEHDHLHIERDSMSTNDRPMGLLIWFAPNNIFKIKPTLLEIGDLTMEKEFGAFSVDEKLETGDFKFETGAPDVPRLTADEASMLRSLIETGAFEVDESGDYDNDEEGAPKKKAKKKLLSKVLKTGGKALLTGGASLIYDAVRKKKAQGDSSVQSQAAVARQAISPTGYDVAPSTSITPGLRFVHPDKNSTVENFAPFKVMNFRVPSCITKQLNDVIGLGRPSVDIFATQPMPAGVAVINLNTPVVGKKLVAGLLLITLGGNNLNAPAGANYTIEIIGNYTDGRVFNSTIFTVQLAENIKKGEVLVTPWEIAGAVPFPSPLVLRNQVDGTFYGGAGLLTNQITINFTGPNGGQVSARYMSIYDGKAQELLNLYQ